MATIAEKTGGRDGFSSSRTIINSFPDKKNIEGLADKYKSKEVTPSEKRFKKDFRRRRSE